MSPSDQTFGSNNPFRRRTDDPSSTASGSGSIAPSSNSFDGSSEQTPRPPFTTFRAATEDDKQGDGGDSIQTKPKKIVKRVRVQSPPPSSPEDVVPVRIYRPEDDTDRSSVDTTDDDDVNDPFNNRQLEEPEAAPDVPPLSRPPPNPFSKTLQDLEHGTSEYEGTAANSNRGSLNVDSFRRLLLTGNATVPSRAGGSTAPGIGSTPHELQMPDGASNTDASSISRQSALDVAQETPRTSHEISDLEDHEQKRGVHPSSPLTTNQQPSSARKKPPPPSSRHGRLIKIELGGDGKSGSISQESSPRISIDTARAAATSESGSSRRPASLSASPPSASDINKPLPLPPSHATADDGTDSPFDREAAGKVPEAFAGLTANVRPPTPPLGSTRNRSASHGSTDTTTSVRKPAAPPPRRHGRSESNAPSIRGEPIGTDPPRSSIESARSHTESIRTGPPAPAPPPPRRPAHQRQGSSFASPASPGLGNGPSSPMVKDFGHSPLDQTSRNVSVPRTMSRDSISKLAKPPPPPARNSSVRRPTSTNHNDTSRRRPNSDRDSGIAAPPPPPSRRARGSSKGSIEAPSVGSRRTSAEVPRVNEEDYAEEPGAGADILKDLEALKREVDAALGKAG